MDNETQRTKAQARWAKGHRSRRLLRFVGASVTSGTVETVSVLGITSHPASSKAPAASARLRFMIPVIRVLFSRFILADP